jgi:hypothetical protein
MHRSDDLIRDGFRQLAREAPDLPSTELIRLRAEILGKTLALERATAPLRIVYAGIYAAAAVAVAVIAAVATAA